MQIAICDEQPAQLELLGQHITRYFQRQDVDWQIQRYTSYVDFSVAINTVDLDLAFIALGEQSETGFVLAHKLLEAQPACNLVFESEHPEFMRDAIGYRPIGYMIQPAGEHEVFDVLDRFLFYYWHHTLHYSLHTREHDRRIPHSHIRYFQSDGHHILIHTTERDQPFTQLRRLNDIEQETAGAGYLRCHQSYLVNMRFVSVLDHRQMRLILTDGAELPVSKRYFNSVVNILLSRNQI